MSLVQGQCHLSIQLASGSASAYEGYPSYQQHGVFPGMSSTSHVNSIQPTRHNEARSSRRPPEHSSPGDSSWRCRPRRLSGLRVSHDKASEARRNGASGSRRRGTTQEEDHRPKHNRSHGRKRPSRTAQESSTQQTLTRSDHEAEGRKRHELTFNRMSTVVVYRVQLATSFVDLYLTYDLIAKYQNSDLANLPGINYDSSLLQAATDTICFIGLGAAYEDQRLIAEARVRYGCALRLLVAEMRTQRPSRRRFRLTITSIMLLRMCELFDALSYGTTGLTNKGWNWHLEAVQRYCEACGPDDLLQTEYDWQLFQNVRHYTFYYDLLHQQASMFAQPRWLLMTATRAQTDSAVALYNLRAQVPGLLARVKAAVVQLSLHPADEALHATIAALETDLHWLRAALKTWMSERGEILDAGAPMDMRSCVPGELDFDPDAREYDLLRASLRYSSVEKAAQCTTCWMLCLTVDGALATLLGAPGACRPSLPPVPSGLSSTITAAPTSSSAPWEDDDSAANDRTATTTTTTTTTSSTSSPRPTPTLPQIHHDAYVCATYLCRSIDWCCSAKIARCSSVGAFHLRFANNFFRKAGRDNEVAWCTALAGAIEARTEETSLVSFPRICRKIATDQFESLCPA